MNYNILRQREFGQGLTDPALEDRIRDDLTRDGWTLLRGFRPDMDGFGDLVGRLCSRVTFDPARSHTTDKTQMVDAGLGPIGLHIENGNTPRCPTSSASSPNAPLLKARRPPSATVSRCGMASMTPARRAGRKR